MSNINDTLEEARAAYIAGYATLVVNELENQNATEKL